MKKFRPYKPGFIVLYVLALLSISDAAYTLVSQTLGRNDAYIANFSLFSYLIAVLAIIYVRMYASTRVEIDGKYMRVVYPVYIKPQPGAKRAMFIFRQGSTDLKLVNKRFLLADMDRYGYIEDLNYSRLDQSGVGENNKLFPIHEIALVMKDGKRYHMNGGYYSPKQLTGMLEKIHAVTGLTAEGKLGDLTPQLKKA